MCCQTLTCGVAVICYHAGLCVWKGADVTCSIATFCTNCASIDCSSNLTGTTTLLHSTVTTCDSVVVSSYATIFSFTIVGSIAVPKEGCSDVTHGLDTVEGTTAQSTVSYKNGLACDNRISWHHGHDWEVLQGGEDHYGDPEHLGGRKGQQIGHFS